MKYTHLLGAAVLAVALGTQGLASVRTNIVSSQNFDGLDTTGSVLVTNHISALNLGDQVGTWYADNEDASEIIAGPISATTSVGAATGEAKHLELKTEGKELKWTPDHVTESLALIEMKVRLVASDTVPSIDTTDTSIHAAVYLFENETNKEDIALYAYAYDPAVGAESNLWVKIADLNTDGCSGLTNGCMMALRVLMDYEEMKASYEGAVISDPTADPIYYPLPLPNDDLLMANQSTAGTGDYATLNSIAFRGTGGVDDLFVKEIEKANTSITMFHEIWAAGSSEPDVTSNVATNDINQSGWSYTGNVDFDESYGGMNVTAVELYDLTGGVTNECTWAIPLVVDSATGDFVVTNANYNFVYEHEYLVKITLTEPVATHTVTFTANNSTYATTNVVHGESIVAPDPAPTLSGSEFDFWCLDPETPVAYVFEGSSVESDLTLYAKFTQLHTVTFTTAHGTAPDPQTVRDGATASEPEDPSETGWTFGGWYTDNGTFASPYSFAAAVTADVALYAKWTEAATSDNVEFGSFEIVTDGALTTPAFTSIVVSNSTVTVTMSAKVQAKEASDPPKTFYATYDTTLGGNQGYTLEATSVVGTAGDPGTVTATFALPADNAAFFTGFTNTENPKPSANAQP